MLSAATNTQHAHSRSWRHLTLALGCCVAGLMLSAQVQAPKPAGGRPRLPPGFVAAADEIVSRMFPEGGPGAAAIIAIDGRPVFRRAYGLADLEFGIMLEPDMGFRIGSLTEQFTTAAVLLLAQRGKLSLQDDVQNHIRGYRDAAGTTIEQLLQPSASGPSLAPLTREVSGDPPRASALSLLPFLRPGANRSASGHPPQLSGTDTDAVLASREGANALLAAVVETASGKTYPGFLRDELFLPAGLSATRFDDGVTVLPRRVHGYVGPADELANAPYLGALDLLARGGIVSNVDDLARWNESVRIGRLLKGDWVDRFSELTTSAPGDLLAAREARQTQIGAHRLSEQAGSIAGFSSHVVRGIDDHVFVAVLSNVPTRRTSVVARLLTALAIGQPGTDPPAVPLTPTTLDSVAGTYRYGAALAAVSRDGEHLQIRIGDDTVQLAATSGSEYFEPGGTLRVSFTTDSRSMIESGWGRPVEWTRTPE